MFIKRQQKTPNISKNVSPKHLVARSEVCFAHEDTIGFHVDRRATHSAHLWLCNSQCKNGEK